ncbi:hypothetical protein ERX46_16485 [Brumimicrobium glaciale]|uniref:Uncharacterized protein n=1 Tax=Brumimicrobium glaciale TaxID=200475 RepID=A0A4Q4KEK5_9FLAO|nr:hypothetical protein [Brumimicrobium glaciale]RYM31502.1 hypothetical protein ERX46_16485 [Brumimicrobium glaciale]
MKLKQALLFILLSPLFIVAQTLRLAIQDEGKLIYYTTILKNGIFHSTNSKNTISIPVKSLDEIMVRHENYEDYSFQVSDGLNSNDTINKIIRLTPLYDTLNIQVFDEFTFSSSKYQNAFKNKDEFIIDYYPFPLNHFYVITRIKREYYVKIIDGIGEELITSKLNFKPEEIFLDAIGNFHLIAKDSVYQIFPTNDSIHLMKAISIENFEVDLRNLVALGKNGAFHQNMSLHDQYFAISRIIDKNVTDIFQTFDAEGYENASYHYNAVVNFYMRTTPDRDNIINMGIWDGKLMSLNNHGFQIMIMTVWSNKIASIPLNVKSYGLKENIIVLDGVRDSVFQIDNETFKTKEAKAHFSLSGDYFKDFFYDNIYMYSSHKGGIVVSKINIVEGTSSEIAQLSDIRKPKNIKVLNDKVFFTVLDDNRYNRIIEVKK